MLTPITITSNPLTSEKYPSLEDNFQQSDHFYKVLKDNGWKTIKLQTKDTNVKITAFSIERIPVISKLFPHFSSLYGPTINNNVTMETIDELLPELCKQTRKHGCVSLEIRTPFPYPYGSEHFHKNGFERRITGGEHSAINDLEMNKNEMLSNMNRNARRCIKKAEKYGVTIKDIDSETELKEFYKIYCNTGKRRDFAPYPYNFIRSLWKLEPSKKTKFFIAQWRKQIIAGILNTFHKKESVPFIMASSNNCWQQRPNHLLVWHSIKYSKEIMGSSQFKLNYMPEKRDPNSNIDYYSFKASFGGKIIEEITSYNKIISPYKQKIHRTLNKIPNWRKFYASACARSLLLQNDCY